MDQETYETYDKIVQKSVYGYLSSHNMNMSNADDYCQECWMSLLEYQKENGELPDPALAKTICQRRIVDQIRKSIARSHTNLDFDKGADDDGDYGGEFADALVGTYKEDEFKIEYQALLDMFPEGSKERTYLNFYLEKAGIADAGINPPSGREQGGYTDSALAKLLGFGGTGNRRWKSFKTYMQDIISDYYDRK